MAHASGLGMLCLNAGAGEDDELLLHCWCSANFELSAQQLARLKGSVVSLAGLAPTALSSPARAAVLTLRRPGRGAGAAGEALPDGWVEQTVEGSGASYYYNKAAPGAVQWQRPGAAGGGAGAADVTLRVAFSHGPHALLALVEQQSLSSDVALGELASAVRSYAEFSIAPFERLFYSAGGAVPGDPSAAHAAELDLLMTQLSERRCLAGASPPGAGLPPFVPEGLAHFRPDAATSRRVADALNGLVAGPRPLEESLHFDAKPLDPMWACAFFRGNLLETQGPAAATRKVATWCTTHGLLQRSPDDKAACKSGTVHLPARGGAFAPAVLSVIALSELTICLMLNQRREPAGVLDPLLTEASLQVAVALERDGTVAKLRAALASPEMASTLEQRDSAGSLTAGMRKLSTGPMVTSGLQNVLVYAVHLSSARGTILMRPSPDIEPALAWQTELREQFFVAAGHIRGALRQYSELPTAASGPSSVKTEAEADSAWLLRYGTDADEGPDAEGPVSIKAFGGRTRAQRHLCGTSEYAVQITLPRQLEEVRAFLGAGQLGGQRSVARILVDNTLTFWVAGFLQDGEETFVCYHDSIPQITAELAWQLSRGM